MRSKLPRKLTLWPAETVHLWSIPLRWPESQLLAAKAILSAEEQAAVARLKLQSHRQGKIAAYAALRSILSRYLPLAPQDLVFKRMSQGKKIKPVLKQPDLSVPLHFNVSHSGDRAVCAVALGLELGVDIERVREGVPVCDLAKRFFAPEEVRALCFAPEGELLRLFYRYWTLKEAYIKAMGRGIASCSLSSFVVDPGAHGWGCLRSVDGCFQKSKNWQLANVGFPDNDYIAALALQGSNFELIPMNYSPDMVDITC